MDLYGIATPIDIDSFAKIICSAPAVNYHPDGLRCGLLEYPLRATIDDQVHDEPF